MKENSIHKVPRTPDSNKLSSFIARKQKYFAKCNKCSHNSTNLRYYYDYLWSNYQKMQKLDKILVSKKDLKKEPEINMYLNNLDTCEFHYKRDQYKSKFITILKMLYSDYQHILTKLFLEFNFTDSEEKDVRSFLQKIKSNSLSEEEVIEWVNKQGVKLARSIYICMLEKKLPSNIIAFFGQTPEIYGQFTSLDIQKDIELNLQNANQYLFQLSNNQDIDIKLDLTVHSRSSNYNLKDRMLDRIFFLHYLTKNNKIHLTVWNSDKKKMLDFDRKDRYIGPKEINSGCTTFMGDNKVSIWRKEELNKVIMHEIFHSVELEQKGNLNELNDFIYHHFDIRKENNKFNFFESYVETFADIINVFLITAETFNYSIEKTKRLLYGGKKKKYVTIKKNKLTKNKITKTNLTKTNLTKTVNNIDHERLVMFYDLIWIETGWVLFQAAKVLHYFGYHNFEQFYFSKGIKEDKKSKNYLQKSNVFSYIIVRSLIFFKLDEFLKMCRENNNNKPLQHNIPNSEMIKFMESVLKDKNYTLTINKMLELVREMSKKKKHSLVYSSMRMTCIEYK